MSPPPGPAAGVSRPCQNCGETLSPGDRFCEACGTRDGAYGPPPVPAAWDVSETWDPPTDPGSRRARCLRCAAGAVGEDGYCDSCGRSQPRARDHVEVDLGMAAGASDRGRRHHRNEDALALRRVDGEGRWMPATIAVVCDGVSSSERADEASEVAARSGADALEAALRAGAGPEAATRRAFASAFAAVADLASFPGSHAAPASTYISAVVTAAAVTVGWVGDSRAYWIGANGADVMASSRLTEDDSWAAAMVATGMLSDAEAAADALAHAITAWLGADAGEVDPHVVTFEPGGPGVVVVCSDGLWNYLGTAEQLGAALPRDAASAPLAAARELVRVALEAGGHDNVTVAVMPCEPQVSEEGR